jgi:hypothetical protein
VKELVFVYEKRTTRTDFVLPLLPQNESRFSFQNFVVLKKSRKSMTAESAQNISETHCSTLSSKSFKVK